MSINNHDLPLATCFRFEPEAYYENLSQNDLSDHVVIICGCFHHANITSTTSQILSKNGAQLVLVDLDVYEDQLKELAKKCDQVAKHGNRWHVKNGKWQRVQRTICFTVQALTDDLAITNMINKVQDQFGRIDALVFAASNHRPSDSLEKSRLVANLSRKLDQQFMAFASLIRLLVPVLEQTNGTIVNLSTVQALKPDPAHLSSSMTQSAVDMLVKSLSLELGPRKIRINSINYLVATNHNPQVAGFEVNQQMVDQFLERIEQTGRKRTLFDNVALAVLYLMSPRSSFLNGINLIVDQGKTL